ncbi:MAG: glutathione-regulated potassium-efflux system protein KefC, partial [Xylophilus sp.]|nr:glutathione-regulated potassium-efflux system protein KefC [Xylophilus sp.]
HMYQLRDRNVPAIERELFDASMRSARSVLEALGWPAHEARQSAMRFRQMNLDLTEQIYPHYKDRARLISASKQGRNQLAEQIAREREAQAKRRPQNWGD